MTTRRYTLIHSILALTALAGCSASPGEETASGSAALSLPSDANWASGLSQDAIVVGQDGDGAPLYSCRVAFGGSIAPGKTRSNWNTCDIGYGGLQQSATPFQTLIPVWTASTYGQIPPTAVPYGVENGQPLYVCRVLMPSFQYQLGKIGNGIPGCDYAYNGVEVTAPGYEVLANKNEFDIGLQSVAKGAAIPYNALRGGTDSNGAALYPCVAPYNGDLHPGKTEAGWGVCDISYGGGEQFVPANYQVLVAQLTAAPLGYAVTEYVGGTDVNGTPLGVCATPYQGGMQVGKLLSNGACDFAYAGKEIALTSGTQILAFHYDTRPIVESANVVLDTGIALTSTVTITLNDDGSYVFAGTNHDSGFVPYNESTLAVIETGDGVVFTFTRSGSSQGTVDCPFGGCQRDDNWSTPGTNPAIAQHWADLKKGLSGHAQTTVSLNWGQLWSDAQAAVGDAKQVISVVGQVL